MNNLLKGLAVVAFLLGYLFGAVPSAKATPQFSYAGYHVNQSNRGAHAYIAWTNPQVPTGQSLEWVMSRNTSGTQYIQIGWIKRSIDSAPYYFGEYGICNPPCQQVGPDSPNGAAHDYQVNLNSTNEYWVFRIDGVVQANIPWQNVGFQQAGRADYEGESSDTLAQIGGTATSHLRLQNTTYSTAPGVWYQVNPANFTSTTTTGTCYRASKGTASNLTFVDNWTLFSSC